MNPTPHPIFWLHLLGWLAGQTAVAVVLAAVTERFVRSPAWRRALWQAAFVALALVLAAELTGVGRRLVPRPAPNQPTRKAVVQANLPATLKLDEPTTPAFLPAAPIVQSVVQPPAPLWWPGWLWLAGSGVLFARFAAARLLLLTAGKRRLAGDEVLHRQVEAIRQRIGLRRRVRLLEFKALRSPIAFGVLRPAIGLPRGFGEAFSPAQREAMLAHELAHLAARDPLWHGLAELVTAALWWHPLAWWARRQLHAASETAADEASLVVDNGPSLLAECLVDLGRRLHRRPALVWLGVEGGGYRSGLGRRVERLLRLHGAQWRPAGRTGRLALLAAACGGVALTVVVSAWAAPQSDASPTLLAMMQEALVGADPSAPSEGAAQDPVVLRSMVFKLNPPAILFGDSAGTNGSVQKLKDHLTAAGVNFAKPAGKSIFFNDGTGLLLVRATSADLKIIEKAVDKLNSFVSQTNATATARTEPTPANRTNTLHAQTLVQDGKLLYEMGRLDEAEKKFRQAWREDPDNKAAPYYLDLISAARFGSAAQNKEEVAQLPTGSGRLNIVGKLNRIRLDEVRYDGLELSEVVRNLSEEARTRDPDKKGINFLMMSDSPAAAFPPANATDPTTGLPVPPPAGDAPEDIGTVRIKISPAITNLSLVNVLDAIVKAADKPIKYSIEDYAIVFSYQQVEAIPLFTKTFKVDGNTFKERLNGFLQEPSSVAFAYVSGKQGGYGTTSNSFAGLSQAVRDFCTARGVDFTTPPGKAVVYNDREGNLTVRATLDDLDIIEQAIQVLTAAPPQVSIQAKFIEITQDSRALGFEWYSGNVLIARSGSNGPVGVAPATNAPPGSVNTQGVFPGGPIVSTPGPGRSSPNSSPLSQGLQNAPAQLAGAAKVEEMRGDELDWSGRHLTNAHNVLVSLVRGSDMTGILTEPQARVVLRALEQRNETDILAAPQVVTLSGRQAQIKTVQNLKVVTGFDQQGGPVNESLESGPVLDVVPTVLADGYTLELSLVASLAEFLGYATNRVNSPAGAPGLAAQPTPHVRVRQVMAHVRVWDGQTVVLGAPVVEGAGGVQRRLLVLITPTIVDPAGNRAHSLDEMPFSTNSVPPQPPPPPAK